MQPLQSNCLADVDEEYTYGDVRKCGLKFQILLKVDINGNRVCEV